MIAIGPAVVRGGTAIAMIAMLLIVLSAVPARGHANLVSSAPTQGAQLEDPPAEISFTMDEPVELVEGSVGLIDEQNRQIPLEDPTVSSEGTVIAVAVAEELDEGAYLASMRAVSSDSHVVAYSIQFTVGEADLSGLGEIGEYGQAGGGWTTVIQVARLLGYAGAVLSFGVLIALGVSGTKTSGRQENGPLYRSRLMVTTVTGAILLVVGAGLNLTAHGPYSLGADDYRALLRLEGLSATLSSTLGGLLVLRIAAAVLLGGWALWRPSGADDRLPAIAVPFGFGALIAYTFAAGGHASVGTDAVPAMISTAAHVLAMSVWMGGIVVLLLGGREPVLRPRWSVLALICLLVIIGTGIYQSARRVYPLESLWGTDYGLLLLGKAAGVTAILGGAFWARRWLKGQRGGQLPARIEAALGAAVLVLTTVLTSAVPARDDYGPPLTVTAVLERGSMAVHADTTRRGPVTLRLEPDRAAQERLVGISATLSSEEAGIARLPVALDADQGVWTSSHVIVPAPGEWTLSIVVDDGTSPVVTAVRYVVW